MKKAFLMSGLFCFTTLALVSCRETSEKETTVIKEVQVEKPEEREGALERTARKIDEKVNKEIDEEIDKIGDDN